MVKYRSYVKNSCNSIRIIGGKWKGRKIQVASHADVRPTTSVMRETLFNWLHFVVPGAICLDCFAGSGALGLEALSRGAYNVTFLERNIICVRNLMRIIREFQTTHNSEVIHTNSLSWIVNSSKVYNIIFIDPPFTESIIFEFIILLEKYTNFSKKSWIYIETSSDKNILNKNFLPNYWILYKKK